MRIWFPLLLIVVAAAAGILVLRHRKAIADFIVERNRRLFGVNLNASQAPKSMLVVGCGFLVLLETDSGVIMLTREQLKRLVMKDLAGSDLVAQLLPERRACALAEDVA